MGADVIKDRYEPLAIVGRGGQGEVIRARDLLHDRIVAIKRRRAPAEAERSALLSEARLLLGIRPHPNLSLVREDFFDAEGYCLVMDWIDGETLQTVIDRGERVPLDRAIEILGDVASALDHIHGGATPVIHRDVKPANVIVTPEGRAVLVDLGIAGAAGVGSTGTGTRGYTAPEIAALQPATIAADVFGLAATAYALLTGAPPRAGARPRWKGIPKDRAASIDAALRRALATDPTRRPPSASALVASLRPDAAMPNNLPLHLTSFVGREHAVAEVAALTRSARMVTLTGPGGIGKTRLATAVAAEELPRHPDGAWFVDLSAVADAALVAHAVAGAAGARETPGSTIEDALVDHLMTRSALIVLDNCEHLVDACAGVATLLLRSCPSLRVLATSRETLGVAGEVVWRVPPLSLPEDDPRSSEAVRLFVERARLVQPSFALSDADASAVASVCERLDGIPLAIELAAARVNVLSPREIAARIDDRFRLLTVPRGDPSSRRRSLRAVLDWSHDLLTGDERTLLRRLSVFAGGWTLEAAEAIAIDRDGVLDLLSALVDKSLVVADDAGASTRYSMLETIRSYAAERLGEAGDAADAHARHVAWCVSLAERAEPKLEGAEQAAAMDLLEAEHDNIRVALTACAASGSGHDHDDGLRIAAAVWRFWDVRGYLTEGRRRIEALLAAGTEAPLPLRARALRAAGGLALDQGDYDAARSHCERSLDIARASGDRHVIASSLNGLAIAAGSQSDFATERALYEESLPIWRELGNLRGVAVTLGNMGTAAYEQGSFDTARDLLEESLAIRRELGDRQGIASSLNSLALVAGASGDHDAEDARYAECLEIWRELGYRRGVAVALLNMGVSAMERGDPAVARPLLEESVATLRELGVRSDLAEALHSLGEVTRSGGDAAAASELFREALGIRVALGDRRGIASSLEAAAGIHLASGDASACVTLVAAAGRLRESVGAPPSPGAQAVVEHDLNEARERLGAEEFEHARRRGAALDADDAVALASGTPSA